MSPAMAVFVVMSVSSTVLACVGATKEPTINPRIASVERTRVIANHRGMAHKLQKGAEMTSGVKDLSAAGAAYAAILRGLLPILFLALTTGSVCIFVRLGSRTANQTASVRLTGRSICSGYLF
jgi:hypothetical protein